MHWKEIEFPLKELYHKKELTDYFKKDSNYLKASFNEIENIWRKEIGRINKINYVMFSEAPLWGNSKSYLYNESTKLTQFFFKSDLEFAIESEIENKFYFLRKLRDLGFIVVDISPFALNEVDTKINYKSISKKDYFNLISKIRESFLIEKLKSIKSKTDRNTLYFFRYLRVKNLFQDIVFKTLNDLEMINDITKIKDIAKKGGGVDRIKLKKLLQ
jgi:hypothetical protein